MPTVGYDTSCETLIDITGSGVTVLNDPTQGPFEGSDDTLVGVLNESSVEIYSLGLSSSNGIFDFDTDGVCQSPTG